MPTSPFSNESLDLVLMTLLRKCCVHNVYFSLAYAEIASVGATNGLEKPRLNLPQAAGMPKTNIFWGHYVTGIFKF